MKISRQLRFNSLQLQPFPFPMELAMEAYLAENEQLIDLQELNLPDLVYNTHELSIDLGNDKTGRIDLIFNTNNDDKDALVICELKLNDIDLKAYDQLKEYLSYPKNIVKALQEKDSGKSNTASIQTEYEMYGLLIGKAIQPDVMEKITNDDSCFISALTLNRYREEKTGQVFVSSEVFVGKKSNKDFSKFMFNNEVYGKGPLVHAVIKHWIEKNDLSDDQAISKFNLNRGGKYNYLMTKEKAIEVAESEQEFKKRFFSEPIKTSGGENLYVWRGWNVTSITNFIKYVNENLNGIRIIEL